MRGNCTQQHTAYLIASEDGFVSCSAVRRLPDNKAYDSNCIVEVDVTYTEYDKTGFRTAPISVRLTPPAKALASDPSPLPTICGLRAAYLKPKEFTLHIDV